LRRRIKRDQLAGVLVTPGGGGEVNAAGRFPGLEWRVQRSCATSADTSATVAVPATVVVAANARSRPSPRLRSLPGKSAAALEATRCRSTRGFPARGRRARKAGALPWTTAAPSTTLFLFWLARAAPRFDDDVGSGEAAVGEVALGYPAPLPAPTKRFAEASWSAGVPTSVAGSWSAAEPATSMRVRALLPSPPIRGTFRTARATRRLPMRPPGIDGARPARLVERSGSSSYFRWLRNVATTR